MSSADYQKFVSLKEELEYMRTLCPHQYSPRKCQLTCGRRHVERSHYPCIHFYRGHCKLTHKCPFRHALKRKIVRPDPHPDICRSFIEHGSCFHGKNCKYSHELRGEPCAWNSLGVCKYSALECRFSHELKAEIVFPCFFQLMGECRRDGCTYSHAFDNLRHLAYEGPLG